MKYINQLFAFNSSRVRLLSENENFAKMIPKGSLVLDAGAGNQIYKSLLKHTQYESADFEQIEKEYISSTYVCDLKNIPVEDCRFDFIFFNQVMEHLPDPKLVLLELNRVLKPGGKMIYTGPLFYEEHEIPFDFYRYTQFGLKELFSKTGFHIERLEWLEGYFGTVGYQLNRMSDYLPVNPKDMGNGIVGYCLVPLMFLMKIGFGLSSILFHKLEMRAKFTKKGYPKNYVSIIYK